MKKFLKHIPLLLFAVFMLGYSLFNVLTPAKAFSEMENRPLAQLPTPTVKTLVNNEFSAQFDVYISDQFAYRNQWISAKSRLESALGKTENNDILYGKDDYMFDKTFSFNTQQFERNLGYVKEFSTLEEVQGKSLYFTLVPSASNILSDKLPAGVPLADEQGLIDQGYKDIEKNAPTLQVLDVSSALTKPEEYIYYRTDHHWTTTGAYYAYQEFLQKTLGISPKPLSSLTSHTVSDFYGTYYSKAKKANTVPDEIIYYDIPVSRVDIGDKEYASLYDTEQFSKRDKYAGFLHSNNGVTVIHSTSPTAVPGSSLMLFKDSYGNSYAPFLAETYETVVVVDARYLARISQVLEDYPVDAYHIMYSFKNFTEDDNIVKLAGLL